MTKKAKHQKQSAASEPVPSVPDEPTPAPAIDARQMIKRNIAISAIAAAALTPIGLPVIAKNLGVTATFTTTRSLPWEGHDGLWRIHLDCGEGWFLCTEVTPIPASL